MHLLYKITNTKNGKLYIGQTEKTLQDRWKRHCHTNSCKHLRNAINYYGKEFFTITLLTISATQECTDMLERYFINKYKSSNRLYGYNIRSGGKEGSSISARSRKIISEKNSGIGNGQSKLNEQQVIAIRIDPRSEYTIAKEYGVSRGSIGDIKHKRTWKYLITPIISKDNRHNSGEEWHKQRKNNKT